MSGFEKMVRDFKKKLSKGRWEFENYLLSFNERRIVLKLIDMYIEVM